MRGVWERRSSRVQPPLWRHSSPVPKFRHHDSGNQHAEATRVAAFGILPLHVQAPGSDPQVGEQILSRKQHRPGSRVTVTGIYRVYHKSHRLMHEAALLAGSVFPCCKQCGRAVKFELSATVEAKNVVPFRPGVILEECAAAKALAAAADGKRRA